MKYHPKSIPFIIKSQSVDEVPPTVNTCTLSPPLQPPTPSSNTHTQTTITLSPFHTHTLQTTLSSPYLPPPPPATHILQSHSHLPLHTPYKTTFCSNSHLICLMRARCRFFLSKDPLFQISLPSENWNSRTCTQPHCRQHLADLQHTCTHLHTTTLPSAPG